MANHLSEVIANNNGEIYATKLTAGKHTAIADEPVAVGGKDLGPTPGDYLCMSLASCKAITLRMYIERKKWDVKEIKVKVRLFKDEQNNVANHSFFAEVLIDGTVSDEQRERLLYIAKACPISKLVSKQNTVDTKVVTHFAL